VRKFFAILLAVTSGLTKAAQPHADSVYKLQGDHVILPAWDNERRSSPKVVLEVLPTQFEKSAHVYNERVIIENSTAKTLELQIPASNEIQLMCRGREADGMFPLISVRIENTTGTTTEVYRGLVASHTLTTMSFRLPATCTNRLGRVALEVLNTSPQDDHRALYVAAIRFVSMERETINP
jgi:hypothetical protein